MILSHCSHPLFLCERVFQYFLSMMCGFFSSSSQSKCNAYMLLTFPETAQIRTNGFGSQMNLAVSVSGWAGGSAMMSWTKYLSTLQRPEKGWLVCLTSVHICRTDNGNRGQTCMYFPFLLWTSPCHRLPLRQTISEQTTLLHPISLMAWFSPQLFIKREI